MRLQEIIGIVREYFLLALTALIVLAVVFLIGYFIVYRKLLKGKKRLPKKQLFFGGLFIGYVIMVLGVTFLNRGSNFYGGMNLSFFSTYREAWYNFNLRHWQFVILNIVMFAPLGILLPLLHPRFKRVIWTIGVAFFFTLSIEFPQLITGYGNFEIDDLFNNLLGAIIGYGIMNGFIKIKEKRIKQSLLSFSPLLLVVILFGGTFTVYHLKEFGNLSIAPIYKTNMAQATTTTDVQLSDQKQTVPIYKAPSYTKDAANEFVIDFFKRMHLDTSDIEIISYHDDGIYWIRGEESYNIGFRYLDGSYNYTDFSSFGEGGQQPKDIDEEALKENLTKLGIEIPQGLQFQKVDTGTYEWTVDKKVIENQLLDGSLIVNYYNDDTVKRIDNQLVTYDKVRDIQIKSEQEAYQEISDGKFQYYSENKRVTNLHIHNVEISYYLDSKGYYQPIYAFHSTVDGEYQTILIPGN